MLLTSCDGLRWRYEVSEHADGYLVQMRELDTGELDGFATLFRTMPVAFAFAEMSAVFERFVAGEAEQDDRIALDVAARERAFVDLSDRLDDAGENGVPCDGGERSTRELRLVLH